MTVLLIGYGNPGRRDDGLGPALAGAIAAADLPGVEVESGYQLLPEDAIAVARHGEVVFADADASADAPYRFEPVHPAGTPGFTTHSLSPAALLGLAEEHFGARPRAFLLGIRGYDFDGFGEELSDGARRNLAAAVAFLAERLGRGR